MAWALLPLIVLLVAAAATDCASRRIPHRLIAWGALSAVVSQAALPAGLHPLAALDPGTPGLLSGLAAAALMLVLSYALWRVGLFGAGDAKWLTVTAAHAGPALVPAQLLLTAVAGGVLALIWKAARRQDSMPYAVAIAAGQFALMAWVATGSSLGTGWAIPQGLNALSVGARHPGPGLWPP